MAKTTENAKTLREQLAEKANKDMRLEIKAVAVIAEELGELVDRFAKQYDSYLVTNVEVGKEEAQKVNKNGEPMFFDKEKHWRKGTREALIADGIPEERIIPYHDTIYEERHIEFDELDDYDKTRAIAYKRLAEFFANLDPRKV